MVSFLQHMSVMLRRKLTHKDMQNYCTT